jgi:hypothetical protein
MATCQTDGNTPSAPPSLDTFAFEFLQPEAYISNVTPSIWKYSRGHVSMKLTDLIPDMDRLETELEFFERRFGIKSAQSYEAMNNVELEEFDGLDDFRMKFIEWLSLYKTWRNLNESY